MFLPNYGSLSLISLNFLRAFPVRNSLCFPWTTMNFLRAFPELHFVFHTMFFLDYDELLASFSRTSLCFPCTTREQKQPKVPVVAKFIIFALEDRFKVGSSCYFEFVISISSLKHNENGTFQLSSIPRL